MFSAYFRKFAKIAYENLGSQPRIVADPKSGIAGSPGITDDRLYKKQENKKRYDKRITS